MELDSGSEIGRFRRASLYCAAQKCPLICNINAAELGALIGLWQTCQHLAQLACAGCLGGVGIIKDSHENSDH